jgi:hypothetical protein
MTAIRRAAAGSVLALVLALPRAPCGRGSPTPTPAPPGAAPTAEATTPPAPTSPDPATSTPGDRVLSTRVTYQWHWPNWNGPATVTHPDRVPLPQLVAIGAGDHPRDPGERPFNRMSFTLTAQGQHRYVVAIDVDAS